MLFLSISLVYHPEESSSTVIPETHSISKKQSTPKTMNSTALAFTGLAVAGLPLSIRWWRHEKSNNAVTFPSKKRTKLHPFLQQVQDSLPIHPPRLCEEGVGGTYFLSDSDGNELAVFKPSDEEPFAPCDPKKKLNAPMPGIKPGTGWLREIAAFKLDHDQLANVPETISATLENENFHKGKRKQGSLQAFVKNDGESWDLGPSLFDKRDVMAIAQLDIRLGNMDRNGGNMLVKRKEGESKAFNLIPIDHCYSLPELDKLSGASFDWLYWKQVKGPIDDDLKEYIHKIDVEHDAQILREIGLEESSVDTMKVCTTLLKKGVKSGMTLFEIGEMMCRKGKEKSELEILVEKAQERQGEDFFTAFASILESKFEERLAETKRSKTRIF